jgi:hypothetical protein
LGARVFSPLEAEIFGIALRFDEAEHPIGDGEDGPTISTSDTVVVNAEVPLATQTAEHREQPFKMTSAGTAVVRCLSYRFFSRDCRIRCHQSFIHVRALDPSRLDY